jgi:hypothetical protein
MEHRGFFTYCGSAREICTFRGTCRPLGAALSEKRFNFNDALSHWWCHPTKDVACHGK